MNLAMHIDKCTYSSVDGKWTMGYENLNISQMIEDMIYSPSMRSHVRGEMDLFVVRLKQQAIRQLKIENNTNLASKFERKHYLEVKGGKLGAILDGLNFSQHVDLDFDGAYLIWLAYLLWTIFVAILGLCVLKIISFTLAPIPFEPVICWGVMIPIMLCLLIIPIIFIIVFGGLQELSFDTVSFVNQYNEAMKNVLNDLFDINEESNVNAFSFNKYIEESAKEPKFNAAIGSSPWILLAAYFIYQIAMCIVIFIECIHFDCSPCWPMNVIQTKFGEYSADWNK